MNDTRRTTALTDLRHQGRSALAIQRQRAQEVLAHIRRNLGLISDAFYELGEGLRELHNNQLYVALGYQTFREMLQEENLGGYSQALKLIQVVTHIPREHAVQLGAEKCYAITRYARADPDAPDIKALLSGRAEIDGKALSDWTATDLHALTRKLATRKRSVSDADARRTARTAQAALRQHGFSGATVTARSGRHGISFRVVLDMDQGVLARLTRLK
ncbi:MAG: hypothetical protein AB2A00_17235 [Myxococcota bacterium]